MMHIVQHIGRQSKRYWNELGWQQKLLWGVVLVVAIRLLAPLSMSGFPVTHDGEGHVARAANYAVAVRQGHIPPRIAPTFADGYGYPVFNFHYPLLNMLSGPLVVLGMHPEFVLKFWIAAAWIALWSGVFLYASQVLKKSTAALIALLICMTSPYWYSLVYVRGSFGELLAAAACTWAFFRIEATSKTASSRHAVRIGLTLTVAALLLAHNIYAVLLFPLTFLYAWYRSAARFPKWQVVREFALAWSIAAFFWVPALLEKHYTVFDEKFGNFYREHFVSATQLLSSSVTYGVSTPGENDSLSYGLGFAVLITILTAVIYAVQAGIARINLGKRIPFFLVSIAVAVLLLLPISLPIWEVSYVLPYLQFPWRLLGPISVVAALLAAQFWPRLPQFGRGLLLLGIAASTITTAWWYWPATTTNTREHYLNYRQSTTLIDELRAKTFTLPAGQLSSQQPIVQGSAVVSIEKWRGTYRQYRVEAAESVVIIEPTMYFPGWEVSANGTKLPQLTDPLYQGQVAYELPPGSWQIYSAITQNTAPRLVGNVLTLLAGGYIGVLLFRGLRSKRTTR